MNPVIPALLIGAAGLGVYELSTLGIRIVGDSTGTVGIAPAFFPPISWMYTARTRKARTIFMNVSRELGIQYVDLFREKGAELFPGDPDRYDTPDYLHPSSEGYRVWDEELKKQAGIARILGQASAAPAEDVKKGHPPTPEQS